MAVSRYVLAEGDEFRGVILWDGEQPLSLADGWRTVPAAQWPGPWNEPEPVEVANKRVLESRADDALEAMRAHVARGTFTTQQMTNAMLLVLRVLTVLVRLQLNRLDGTD